MKQPLVTLILITYNQEEFVLEACKAIVKQDYSPLEIIISDDCSLDNTYGLIVDFFENYSGKHSVVLNRNAENAGISGHLNDMLHMAKGEYIFIAAGDDISSQSRVSRVMREWLSPNNTNMAYFSNLQRIDQEGISLGNLFQAVPQFSRSIEEFGKGKKCWTVGAALAIHRRVFSEFGAIPSNVMQEDGCLAFRALLLGGIGYVDEVLIKYRFHANSLSQHNSASKRLYLQRREYYMHTARLRDLRGLGIQQGQLLRIVERQKRCAWGRHVLFALPCLGWLYNFIRINLKNNKKNE